MNQKTVSENPQGKYRLDRFIEAQKRDYETALREIKNGRKRSHWIWYIFPQIKGLGFSPTSEYYGIDGLEEAKAYWQNAYLRAHLLEITKALLALETSDPTQVMGYPDDLKLRSSMTLFSLTAPDEPVFQAVLEKYFNGQPDQQTVRETAISVEQMRASDAYTIEHFVESKELMYRAADGVFRAYDGWQDKRIAILAGGGNNGGDGYALVGILWKNDIPVTVFQVSDKLSEDGKYYYEDALRNGADIRVFSEETALSEYDVIVDCILGTGFSGEVRGMAGTAITAINHAHAFVISVDINSGLNGDTGEGTLAVRSDLTVSIGYYKKGLFTGDAPRLIGRLCNVDIGIGLV